MNNQESDSKPSNKINGYISWNSNAPSLSNKLTANLNEDDEELKNYTPLNLFQSVPVMAPSAMLALPPLDEHHVNYV